MHARLLVEEAEGINTRTTSPDGRYVWIANPVEARMSLWIVEGELWLKEPATLLFAPPTSWSFEERAWTSPSTLEMRARCFPGTRAGIVMWLEVASGLGTIGSLPPYAHSKASPQPPDGAQRFDVLRAWLESFPRG